MLKANTYDKLLILATALLAFGNIGGFLQPTRVLILLLLPILIKDLTRNSTTWQRPFRYERGFFIVWTIWGLASLPFVLILGDSSKYLLHLIINFLAFFELLWLASKSENPQQSILLGWMILFLITAPIATYEFLTDQHLAAASQDANMTVSVGRHIREERRFASVTYGNLNSYNTLLCYCLAIFLCSFSYFQKSGRIVALIALIGTCLILITNASRAAFLCMVIAFAVYFIFTIFQQRNFKTGIAVILVGGLLGYFAISNNILYVIAERFSYQGFSDYGRLMVIRYGLEELNHTYGLGVGAGNFIPIMALKYRLLICAPHNLWLEVLCQFGVLIFLGFLGTFIHLIAISRKGEKRNLLSALLSLAILLPASIIDSTYLQKMHTWFFFATLYILCSSQFNQTSSPTPDDLSADMAENSDESLSVAS